MLKKIAFICVNFNNNKFTSDLCVSLNKQAQDVFPFSIDLIIVDNAGTPEEIAALLEIEKNYEFVRCIYSDKNLGYFGGLNLGLQKIDRHKYDYIVIGNNDLFFDESFCHTLLSKNYNNDVYSICPDVITKDGFHQNPHVFKRISGWRRFQMDVFYTHYYFAVILGFILKIIRPVKRPLQSTEKPCEIHMGIGACYILTKNFLNKFNTLNYPHFLYGEEAYFSDQIHATGGILLFDQSLRVLHAESATLSRMPKRTTYEFARSGYPNYRKMI